MTLTLSVRTLKHVPLEDVLAPLSETLHDIVVEEIGLRASWGDNAQTFVTKRTVLGALEDAMEEFRKDHSEPAVACGTAHYATVVDALKALPQDVFISLGS